MAHSDDDEDDNMPGTQPIMSMILRDVVAYVEVRSGHDNRSRGVKTQLKKLGAEVVDKLNKGVTHVVFNEGQPSTYKKAQKLNCHLVSVLWIEACKIELRKACEAGYPPIGKEIYEDPSSLKNFKKLKSMQPDFDDDVEEMKINQAVKRVQRRCQKRTPISESSANSPLQHNDHPKQKRSRRKAVSTKGLQKMTALKEITPNVVHTPATPVEVETIEIQSSEDSVKRPLSLPERAESSSSDVIFIEPAEIAGPSSKNLKKPSELTDNKQSSRAKFVNGMTNIIRSLSPKNAWLPGEISPWRKRLDEFDSKPKCSEPTRKKVSSKKNPRSPSNKSKAFVVPRRSPRQAKKLESPCVSASAALLRKRKEAPPPSPASDSMFLSQLPGDMPSVDELARTKKGSVHAGNEHFTLSQIVRSYNAVARGTSRSPSVLSGISKISSQPQSEEPGNADGSEKEDENAYQEDTLIDMEDVSNDGEVPGPTRRKNSSDAGSTMSSASTQVLINGMEPDWPDNTAHSSYPLPGSVGVDDDEVSAHMGNQESSTIQKTGSEEEYARDPSPIFVIKKAKNRRPLKLQQMKTKSINNMKPITSESDCKKIVNSYRSTETLKRESLDPIDHLNKLIFPRLFSQTPTCAPNEKVLVEETPDVVCPAHDVVPPIVIPPTPAVNSPQCKKEKNGAAASSSQSMGSSVALWLKKSCKVPLFSSRTNKSCETPSFGQAKLSTLPEEISQDASKQSSSSLTRSHAKAGVQESSKETLKSLAVKSRCPKKSQSPAGSQKSPKPVSNTAAKNVESSETVSKQKKIIVDCLSEQLSTPNVQRVDERLSSSGYDTSLSQEGMKNVNAKKKGHSGSKSDSSSAKRKRVEDFMSPIQDVPKKRSDVYEISPTAGETKIDDHKESSCGRLGRKRTKTVESSDNKKQKLNQSDPQHAVKKRSTRSDSKSLSETRSQSDMSDMVRPESSRKFSDKVKGRFTPSRGDSMNLSETRSQSDLSEMVSSKSSRKSSVKAKQRLAQSLTRKSDTSKVIVCTFLTASEQNGVEAAGESLEGWKFEEKVSSRTTHVISNGPKRTMNMLKGMARGCWLVDQKWMLDSSKSGSWLSEDKYELTQFSSAVKQCRLGREAMGKDFQHNLFMKTEAIYVSPKNKAPPAKDIRELLELCGANLKTSFGEAKIIVGDNIGNNGSFHCVQARWVLDCVTKNKILPMNNPTYRMQ